MKKGLFLVLAAFVATLIISASASAEPAPVEGASANNGHWVFPDGKGTIALGVGLGAGIIVLGAAKGIGNIGASAVEAIARQPEAGGRIFTSMLLSAALIEGFTFFALLIQFTLK